MEFDLDLHPVSLKLDIGRMLHSHISNRLDEKLFDLLNSDDDRIRQAVDENLRDYMYYTIHDRLYTNKDVSKTLKFLTQACTERNFNALAMLLAYSIKNKIPLVEGQVSLDLEPYRKKTEAHRSRGESLPDDYKKIIEYLNAPETIDFIDKISQAKTYNKFLNVINIPSVRHTIESFFTHGTQSYRARGGNERSRSPTRSSRFKSKKSSKKSKKSKSKKSKKKPTGK